LGFTINNILINLIKTTYMTSQLLEKSLKDLNNNKSHSDLNKEVSNKKTITQGFSPVLKNRKFVTLWLGQIFSQLADKVYLVLIIAIIAANFQKENQSISGWVSAIMIAFTIPAVLFGSLAGVYVDRWSKKRVLVLSNLIRGIFVFSLPLLLSITANNQGWFNLPAGFWGVLIITFLVSSLTQFFAPAEQATIPLIVKKEHLLAANSLYTTTMMAMLIIGFAIGDPLLELFEQWGKILSFDFGKEFVVGACYAIAGLILLLLKTGEKKEHLNTTENHPFQDIWEGVIYLKQNHRVRNALIQLVILFSVFAALAVLTVRLAETIPGMEASQFGFLLAGAGVGMGIGAAILGHWGHDVSHAKLSLWGSMGVSLSLIGLSMFTHSLIITLFLTITLGGFAALVGVTMQTTIQSETPADMRGKVFGLQNNAVNIALSLPLALAGVAETLFGLQPVLLSLAILAIIGGFLTWLITNI
jgi:MFS family permease